jgi:uncharacterized protein (TIGR02246 family)
MRKFSIACAAFAVANAWLAPLAAAAGPADDAQIRALEARFATAFNAKDVDAIMRIYSPDVFVFDVVPPRQYVGAEAYRKDWQGLMAAFAGPVRFDISDLAVSSDGAIGYSHSIEHVRSSDSQGHDMDMTVRVTDVYRKVGGEWRIVQEHVSAPIDLATGKGDLTSKP